MIRWQGPWWQIGLSSVSGSEIPGSNLNKDILNSWNYSNEKNELSREQQLSTIMLLEKKGKSTEHLNGRLS